MIFDAARLAFGNLFAAETRSAFWKSLGLTILVLVGLWFAIRGIFIWLALPWLDQLLPGIPEWAGWMSFILAILAGIGLALALALLISPVTAIIASLFLDDVAEVIEKKDYPADAPGTAMPLSEAIPSSLKFFGVVILGNIIALLLLLVPGVNLIAFFLVNGYLLGREFFEFAAMRFRSPADARAFRSKHQTKVFMAGLVIAAFLAIPFLNLLTPLFAASMMVHLHKSISKRDPSFSNQLSR
ncbi:MULTISPECIES: sulfate transporter family protein [unclassified Rhizobium]|uniref:sulfate transporter family protein n=1 Tax=unclassified Rhizobium TaxID=2613769 RepID=UPI00177EC223|nr:MULTISPECIES: sulfate transporter family protein [unclassified Rhizobium]MBD8686374.1 sulfate transporter family protein [Rhizobium sp. CFBP 13644]MBD8693631.1 sulfate transporter family protein [Rhizobium sp. CFBP 13717]